MAVTIRKSGALRTVNTVTVRKSGALRTVTAAWVRKSGALRQFIAPAGGGGGGTPLSALIGSSIMYGYCSAASGTCVATTAALTCTASGGTAPYTYSWEVYSDLFPSTPLTFTSPTAATTTARRTAPVALHPSPKDAFVRCRVTDAVGNSVYTSTEQVSTTHEKDTGI